MEVANSDPNQGENRPKRKVKLIMLRYKTNYNLVLKELNNKYPNSVNKLIREYIRITRISEDQHREITATLKTIVEEFYAIPQPLAKGRTKLYLKDYQRRPTYMK
ncbi:hypothetical protein TNCT_263641 [Trichonephila clavata]|uniref:Uncharacterized protein n=1 Tax=Trichonephila clavata TaxID=2740835 RepID=A0A8X6GBB9_TRICU|nr:hypothetical protein TNCT_263641 [Trichonephila clavata]